MEQPDSSSADVAVAFLTRFFLDRSAGQVQPLEVYQADFPGNEELIARMYGRLEKDDRVGLTSVRGIAGADLPLDLEQLGYYRILQELGRGGQGVVYLAEDTRLPRKVAIKVLSSAASRSLSLRTRFLREAEAASKLDHTGICAVYEMEEEPGLPPYIVMRYVEGESLAKKLSAARGATEARFDEVSFCTDISSGNGDKVEPDTARSSSTSGPTTEDAIFVVVRIVERVAHALHAAHEAGLIHRDIKPGNIMITEEGEPVVLDFGLARMVEGDSPVLTETGQLLGTPAYMSPEQLTGKPLGMDRRTDVYSLGVTLYECLTLHRPFEAPSREQLYRKILESEPPDPRRLNSRIPRDLHRVLQTALEKDLNRRYQSAEAFAEDLRRVRKHEPIQAHPPGPVIRAWKWARRNPGKAVAVAAVLVILLAGAGILLGQKIARDRAEAHHIAMGWHYLSAGLFKEAREEVARARERNDHSRAASELEDALEDAIEAAEAEAEKRKSLEAAAMARKDARQKIREYLTGWQNLHHRKKEENRLYHECFHQYAPTAKRIRLNQLEKENKDRARQLSRVLDMAREALERASRHESPFYKTGHSPEMNAAFSDFFMVRYQQQLQEGDEDGARQQADLVRRWDTEKRYEKELLGRGTLTVMVEPGDADIYLFRYMRYEIVRKDTPVVSRLVPVPTSGIGLNRPGPWLASEGFFPGDRCLEVTGVEADSIAARAGLETGDLIIRLNGQRCGDGMFILMAVDRGQDSRSIVQPVRIEAVNGEAVENSFDWANLPPSEGGEDRLRFAGVSMEIRRDRKSVERFTCCTPRELMKGGTLAELRLLCLHRGVATTLLVPGRVKTGLTVEATAYPRILSPENMIPAGKVRAVDPGSYLLLVRRKGFEDQRYPVLVNRGAAKKVEVRLLEGGTTPPGFVFVPGGPFLYGSDPSASFGVPLEEKVLGGFFIGRKEVTSREYFAFLNDPAVRRKIERMKESSQVRLVPRGRGEGILAKEVDGRLVPFVKGKFPRPYMPVMGVSLCDIREYLKWRNRMAQRDGERWRYDLPTEEEWEKAARGVDLRYYPWGNRLDFSFMIGFWRKKVPLYFLPGGFEPCDESPFGLYDTAGSRFEWTKSKARIKDRSKARITVEYILRGGGYSAVKRGFRVANRHHDAQAHVLNSYGFRLVLRPLD